MTAAALYAVLAPAAIAVRVWLEIRGRRNP